jgi:hypothetical protein
MQQYNQRHMGHMRTAAVVCSSTISVTWGTCVQQQQQCCWHQVGHMHAAAAATTALLVSAGYMCVTRTGFRRKPKQTTAVVHVAVDAMQQWNGQ